MSNLKKNLQAYFDQKQRTEQLNIKLSNKNEELSALQTQLAETEARLNEIRADLSQANRHIAAGLLSIDGLLKLRDELSKKEVVKSTLIDVIAIQKTALKSINDESMRNGFSSENINDRLADSLVDERVSKIAEMDVVKDFVYVAVSTGDLKKGTAERRNAIYTMIGAKICNAVYPLGLSSASIIEARKQFENIIAELPESP